jgi:peptidoglycan/xylan/chitin deacetylase (PgdA/CDA1 family)
MEYLKKNGYEGISLTEAFNKIRMNELLYERVVVLTFDDGFRNIYTDVFPLFKKLGFTGTIFLIPGEMNKSAHWVKRDFREIFLDNGNLSLNNAEMLSRSRALFKKRFPYFASLPPDRMMPMIEQVSRISALQILSWEEVSELSQYGFDFGAHSWSHQFLTELNVSAVREEIGRSKTEIESRLNKPVSFFCYPYGAYNSEIKNIVKDFGFAGACSTQSGITGQENLDLFALKRISINSGCGYFKYRLYLSPFYIYYSLWKNKDRDSTLYAETQ